MTKYCVQSTGLKCWNLYNPDTNSWFRILRNEHLQSGHLALLVPLYMQCNVHVIVFMKVLVLCMQINWFVFFCIVLSTITYLFQYAFTCFSYTHTDICFTTWELYAMVLPVLIFLTYLPSFKWLAYAAYVGTVFLAVAMIVSWSCDLFLTFHLLKYIHKAMYMYECTLYM